MVRIFHFLENDNFYQRINAHLFKKDKVFMSVFFKSFMLVGWLFFVLPLLGMGSCGMVLHKTDSFGTAMFAAIFSCILASIIFFRIFGFFARRAANSLIESVAMKHGLKNEYFCYNDMSKRGFIIDNTQQKVYIGRTNDGVILNFSEISSIQ